MPKLLLVTTIPVTLNFFLPLAKHLRHQGWQVDAMSKDLSCNHEYTNIFDNTWDVDFSRNPLATNNLMIAPQQIYKIVKEQKYNLVNVTTPVAAFATRYALNKLRKTENIKVIYTAQGFNFFKGGALHKNAIFLALEMLAGQWTDYLVVVNKEDEETAKQYSIVPPDKIYHIAGTGLNLSRFNPNAIDATAIAQLREELGLSAENPLFLSVAEFISRKRHKDILRALAQLNRPKVHLAFAGIGEKFAEMKQLANQLNISQQVHFLGLRKDINLLIRTSNATILASSQEGLPNCVMESLCMETPVIGTDIRGTRDLIKSTNGILVKVGDVNGIAKAMERILDYPVESQQMGKQGRLHMTEYGVPTILKQYEKLYDIALSN